MAVERDMLRRLETAARGALENAYCRYSGFPVGAAVLTEDGTVFAGCNVENASFGLTICAERNAIFQAVAAGHRRVDAVVMVTANSDPTMPCGACRQVINEFGTSATIISIGSGGKSTQFQLEELLPHGFGPDDLK